MKFKDILISSVKQRTVLQVGEHPRILKPVFGFATN